MVQHSPSSDSRLLTDFVADSHAAFAELVSRHLNAVYSSARRRANFDSALTNYAVPELAMAPPNDFFVRRASGTKGNSPQQAGQDGKTRVRDIRPLALSVFYCGPMVSSQKRRPAAGMRECGGTPLLLATRDSGLSTQSKKGPGSVFSGTESDPFSPEVRPAGQTAEMTAPVPIREINGHGRGFRIQWLRLVR